MPRLRCARPRSARSRASATISSSCTGSRTWPTRTRTRACRPSASRRCRSSTTTGWASSRSRSTRSTREPDAKVRSTIAEQLSYQPATAMQRIWGIAQRLAADPDEEVRRVARLPVLQHGEDAAAPPDRAAHGAAGSVARGSQRGARRRWRRSCRRSKPPRSTGTSSRKRAARTTSGRSCEASVITATTTT